MKIFREMLFLEGYSSRPQELMDACDRNDDEMRQPTTRSLLDTLWLLGGRPMHRGHNFDLEEDIEYTTLPAKATTTPCECSCQVV